MLAVRKKKCSKIVDKDGWCGPNLSYDQAKADIMCAGAACDASVDRNACFSQNTGLECSSGATDGFCGSNQAYDATGDKADNKCSGESCDDKKLDDKNACCSPTKGQECQAGALTKRRRFLRSEQAPRHHQPGQPQM